MELAIVVGNPKPRSWTLAVATAVADRVALVAGTPVATRTVDLCDHGPDLFRWPHEGLAAVGRTVAACDVVVVASPTYKATYTGLLKAFLDRYANDGLEGVVAVPVMTGGSPHHATAVDTALRPLLVELGASVPSRGLFFVMSQMDRLDAVVAEWAERNVPLIVRTAGR